MTEGKITNVDDKVEEMDTSLKEDVKNKIKIQAQTIQKTWDTMKRSNIQIIGLDKEEET